MGTALLLLLLLLVTGVGSGGGGGGGGGARGACAPLPNIFIGGQWYACAPPPPHTHTLLTPHFYFPLELYVYITLTNNYLAFFIYQLIILWTISLNWHRWLLVNNHIQIQLVYIGSLPKIYKLRVWVPPPPPPPPTHTHFLAPSYVIVSSSSSSSSSSSNSSSSSSKQNTQFWTVMSGLDEWLREKTQCLADQFQTVPISGRPTMFWCPRVSINKYYLHFSMSNKFQ